MNSIETGFGFLVAIEEEGMVGAFPGEVVKPASAVVQVPEGDPCNDVPVVVEELKEGEVFCAEFLSFVRFVAVVVIVNE